MTSPIRLAHEDDTAAMLTIYAPLVRDTAISFETEPPGEAEMRRRLSETLARYPWLVCEREGDVLGYAYASSHRSRAAYQWAVEVSVYVDASARRKNVGRALYTALFGVLALQGFVNAYAGITLPNAASVALHEKMGFSPMGVYRHVGYKLGAWHDVGWWARLIQPLPDAPAPPRSLPEVVQTQAWTAALGAGVERLRC